MYTVYEVNQWCLVPTLLHKQLRSLQRSKTNQAFCIAKAISSAFENKPRLLHKQMRTLQRSKTNQEKIDFSEIQL
jgi:hypothetical protein